MPGWGLLVRLGFQTDRQTSVLPTRHCGVIRVPGELLPGTQRTSLHQDLPQGAQGLWVGCQSRPLSRQDKKPRSGTVPSSLDYVTRGMWNSLVSKIRGLLGGLGSLSALCSSLKSPVPMFMGIPIMMHSDTPETNQTGH